MGKCMSKQKATRAGNRPIEPSQNRPGVNPHNPNNNNNNNLRHDRENRTMSANFGHPSLANENYESVRGEDVEEIHLSELKVLGENKSKQNIQGQPRRLHRPAVTEGGSLVSPLFSVGNEGENKMPLNTNISATGQDIFMIEDGGNKSSKDGRQSSVGQEIFHSKPK